MSRIGTLAIVLLSLGGCTSSRSLTRDHGKSYHATMDAQRASASGAATEAEKGLDAQEATIVANSYRQSLAPKGAKSDEQPEILYVAPQRQGTAQLAPSVPKER